MTDSSMTPYPEPRPSPWAAIVAGIVMIAALQLLGRWVAAKTRDFAERGRPVELVVVGVEPANGHAIASVTYEIDGTRHEWSVTPKSAPRVGDRLAGFYLPEDPTRVRVDLDAAAIEESGRPFRMLSLFVAFAMTLAALLAVNEQALAPLILGGAFAGLLFLSVIDPSTQAFFRRAFPDPIGGLPGSMVATTLALVLFGAPLAVFGGWLGQIALRTSRHSKLGLLLTLVLGDVPPELEPAVRRARVALGALVVVTAAWIAFAASRGI